MPISRRLFVIASAFALSLSTAAQAGNIKIHGSTTVFANLFADHQSTVEAESGQTLTVVANGSSRGVNDLVSGAADMGMISAPLDVTITKIQKKQADFNGDGLVGHDIGSAKVAFVVHPSNSVKSLSTQQIQDILSGKIKNWSEVGGKPMPIKVVMETVGGGVRSMAEEAMLGGELVSADGVEAPNGPQIVKIVQQMPMALGIAAAAVAKNTPVNVLSGHDQPAQPLVLVTKGAPNDAQKAVIDSARSILN